MTFSFSKIASYLDLEHSNLKVELTRDIIIIYIIHNNCVRYIKSPLINARAGTMTMFVCFFLSKNS